VRFRRGPRIRFDTLFISRKAARHIQERHALSPEQVREAFETGGRSANVYRAGTTRQGERIYIVRGVTYAGLPLFVVVRARGRGMASLITAREDR
jgi:hypothetical protein